MVSESASFYSGRAEKAPLEELVPISLLKRVTDTLPYPDSFTIIRAAIVNSPLIGPEATRLYFEYVHRSSQNENTKIGTLAYIPKLFYTAGDRRGYKTWQEFEDFAKITFNTDSVRDSNIIMADLSKRDTALIRKTLLSEHGSPNIVADLERAGFSDAALKGSLEGIGNQIAQVSAKLAGLQNLQKLVESLLGVPESDRRISFLIPGTDEKIA